MADHMSDRELRLESLKLSVANSANAGIRDPIARAEEFLAWCSPAPEKPAASAAAPKRGRPRKS